MDSGAVCSSSATSYSKVPSNLLLQPVSAARRWIARIMITWAILLDGHRRGVTTPLAVLCGGAFCFGAAEAGFFPGMILYLT